MIQRRLPAINILDYGVTYVSDGMNPVRFMEFINFNYNITQIISKTFKKLEVLDRSVIRTFFNLNPAKINTFNHVMDTFILPY